MLLVLLFSVRMYYGSGTVDRTAASGRCCICVGRTLCPLTRWQHFYAWNDVMATILKVWRQIDNLTPSIDAYLLQDNSDKFHPDP